MESNWLDAAILRESTPKALRVGSVEEFAEKWGITSSKYWYEMSKKESWAKILELSLNTAKKSTPDVLQKLQEKAENGDMKAIEMFLDYVLKLAKNLDIKTDGKPFPILDYAISKNNSNGQNNGDEEKDQSDSRGNECLENNINPAVLDTPSPERQETNPN